MVVPIKLAPPMIPTAAAAMTCGIPRSMACGIRCVPINPLAVTPQIKKQPLKIQNVEGLNTSDIAEIDIGRISPRAYAPERLAELFSFSERYGSSPTSAGVSRIHNQMIGISTVDAA